LRKGGLVNQKLGTTNLGNDRALITSSYREEEEEETAIQVTLRIINASNI